MSVVDTTDGDSMNSNGVLMVKDGRRKSGMKKASDRKVAYIICAFRIFTSNNFMFVSTKLSFKKFYYTLVLGSPCKNRPE